MVGTGARGAVGVLVGLLVLTGLAGCGPAAPGAGPTGPSSTVPSSTGPSSTVPSSTVTASPGLPPGLTFEVEIAQRRTERVSRVVVLEVRNTGPVDVTVTGAALTSDLVGGTATEGREVAAGSMRRVAVPLGPASCGPDADGDPVASVALDVTTADGRSGTVVVTPTDRTDDLRRIHGEDCAAAAVARGLRVALADELAVRDVDGAAVADMTLRVEPVPGGPHVRLVAVLGTTLLRPPGADADWVLDVDSAAPPPGGLVVLPAVPARCDLHAIAEDKRGTVLGVRAVVDGVEQPVFHVAASDALRGALYDAVLAACGVPTDTRSG